MQTAPDVEDIASDLRDVLAELSRRDVRSVDIDVAVPADADGISIDMTFPEPAETAPVDGVTRLRWSTPIGRPDDRRVTP